LLLFSTVSLVSPIANAFAIPWVSLGVVPVTLAGTGAWLAGADGLARRCSPLPRASTTGMAGTNFLRDSVFRIDDCGAEAGHSPALSALRWRSCAWARISAIWIACFSPRQTGPGESG
jgi:predicted membrane metal-binding protein